jgi:hypothetical protein
MTGEQSRRMPTRLRMMTSLLRDVSRAFADGMLTGKVRASRRTVTSRLALCTECKRFDSEARRCLECGCFMIVKAQVKVAECPLGRWGAESGAELESGISKEEATQS